MKTRNDFVSNSSSSSFIVISDEVNQEMIDKIKERNQKNLDFYDSLPIPNENGNHEFGWEDIAYPAFEDKINFVGIQLLHMLYSDFYNFLHPEERKKWREENGYSDDYKAPYEGKFKEYYKMLYDVCLETAGIKISMNDEVMKLHGIYGGNTDHIRMSWDSNYYIDHQSTVSEGSCMDMFESKEALKNFLFSDKSYVNTGNDNG